MIAIVLFGLSFGAPLFIVAHGLTASDHARRFGRLSRLRKEVTFAEARIRDMEARLKRVNGGRRKARLARLAADQYCLQFPNVVRIA